jgi:hypothetical protein
MFFDRTGFDNFIVVFLLMGCNFLFWEIDSEEFDNGTKEIMYFLEEEVNWKRHYL